MKRFPLILLVWLGCATAWMVLGTSLVVRTGGMAGEIGREVRLLWGPELEQGHPRAEYAVPRTVVDTEVERNLKGVETRVRKVREVRDTIAAPLGASALAVSLDLVHRRKGLLWFPTYGADFSGRYTFVNPDRVPRELRFS